MNKWMLNLVIIGLMMWVISPGVVESADFNGDSRDDIAIFRPSSGLWSIRGITRVYFGGSGDEARPGDYNGDGIADIAIFRASSGLWSVRGITRVYYGTSGDTPIQGGSGQRTYDYVVKAGDGNDLEDALESNSYTSVFVPAGTYTVDEVILVDYVRDIIGEDKRRTIIHFTSNNYLRVQEDYCRIANIQFQHESANPSFGALVDIDGVQWVVVENCRFDGNDNIQDGLRYDSASHWLQVLNCYAIQCTTGFAGSTSTYGTTFSNCQANNCETGFDSCENLSSCVFRGGDSDDVGFSYCRRMAACKAFRMGIAFSNCNYITSSQVDGSDYTGDFGYSGCSGISSSHAFRCTTPFSSCTHVDSDSVWSSN